MKRRRTGNEKKYGRLYPMELAAMNSAFPDKQRKMQVLKRPLSYEEREFLNNFNTNNYEAMTATQRRRLKEDKIPRRPERRIG
jgi:hypothetical protein